MKIYIGTSGWSYEHWIRNFYPKELERAKWLEFYSENFNTVELNMSYYRIPFPNMIKGWYKKIPENFKFTFKASRFITHVKKLKNINKVLKKFYKLTEIMEEKLGCILFQLPPSFKKNQDTLERLKNFLKKLDKTKRNIIEFRHESWWDEEVYKLMNRHGAGFCIVSGLDMPSKIIVTSKAAYLRFHGPESAYSSKYSDNELKLWARKIRNIKAKEIYAYFNNDTRGYAVKNAKKLKEFLKC